MFLLLLIAVPVLEVFVFVEVGHAIGWLLALVLLLGASLLGARLLRVEGRATIEQVSLAVSERRAPSRSALDHALGFLGAALLALPGFVTGALGALLLLPPGRSLTRRWISRRYAGRVMRFAARGGRFAPGGRGARPADVESTAVDDDDLTRLGR
ncbi:MAG TPA: FxsA family protein [Solirubrobacteraceae bacterium]|jgi:UPF0716 protein FxsA|nr:FxsA family protein [Solirubrobacteraceae bacterium]